MSAKHPSLYALLVLAAVGCGGKKGGEPSPRATCGNGVLDQGEQCDNGAANSVTALGGECRVTCTIAPSVCGNAAVEPGEECDEGADNTASLPDQCRSNCHAPACGDYVVDSGEQCDAGEGHPGPVVSYDNTCRSDCLPARCGDGIVDLTEHCDDANDDDTDGCSQCAVAFTCGDGRRLPGEVCYGTARYITFGLIQADVGDFDADGDLDVITTADFNDEVMILRNDGQGSFTQTDLAAGLSPTSVVAADIDGDGAADGVIINTVSQSVTVIWGSSTGAFSRTTVVRATTLGKPTVGDVDGDGDQDIIVPQPQLQSAALLRNNGNRSFTTEQIDLGQPDVSLLALADLFPSTGKELLAVTGSSLHVYSNEGAGPFTSLATVVTGVAYRAATLGDIDNDGDLDVVVADDAAIEVYTNTAGALHSTQVLTETLVTDVALADLKGDGTLWLLALGVWDNGLAVYTNSAGHFELSEVLAVSTDTGKIAVGDINGDHHNDVLCTYAIYLAALLGDGEGSLQGAPTTHTESRTSLVRTGDMNGDGTQDVLALSADDGRVTVLRNQGAGQLESAPSLVAGVNPSDAVIGDLDHDGDNDVVVALRDENAVVVLNNDGAANLSVALQVPVGAAPRSVILADFDADGALDIATADADDDTVTVAYANGGGGYDVSLSLAAGYMPIYLAAIDLEGDGDLDIISANAASGDITLLANNGARAFVAQDPISIDMDLRRLVPVDVDDDGDQDIVVAGSQDTSRIDRPVRALLNDGTGTFTDSTLLDYVGSGGCLQITDVDGDGSLDYIGLEFHSQVRVYTKPWGLVSEAYPLLLGSPSIYASPGESDLVIEDLNGDAIPDLVMSSYAYDVAVALANP